MTKKDRVSAALKGDDVDRVPVSAWMHFPHLDRTAEGQVKAFSSFQRKFDWDFVKLMFRSSFILEDWGCTFGDYQKPKGFWLPEKYAVESTEDWKKLEVLDTAQGTLGEMLQVVRTVREEIKEDIDMLATVFCPLMVARQLSGDRLLTDLKANPKVLHQALEVICETVIRFARACLESGANGIFFATLSASTSYMSREDYAEFGHPYNLRVLESIEDSSQFTLLHICRTNIMFDDFVDYPVHALNWSDRVTPPTLDQARSKTDRCLIGGIDRMGAIRKGRPEDVEKEALDAMHSVGRRKFMLAPGCGLPIDAPEDNVKALRQVVDKFSP